MNLIEVKTFIEGVHSSVVDLGDSLEVDTVEATEEDTVGAAASSMDPEVASSCSEELDCIHTAVEGIQLEVPSSCCLKS